MPIAMEMVLLIQQIWVLFMRIMVMSTIKQMVAAAILLILTCQ